jgi:hypothetical protein
MAKYTVLSLAQSTLTEPSVEDTPHDEGLWRQISFPGYQWKLIRDNGHMWQVVGVVA